MLKQDLLNEIEGIDPDDIIWTPKNRWKHMFLDFIPIVVIFISFLIYGNIMWEYDIKGAQAYDIYIDGEILSQEIFLGLSTTIFINYTIMIAWLRYFQLNDFKIRWWTLLISVITFILMFIVGVIIEITDIDQISFKIRSITLLMYILIPIYLFSIWIFYGIWRHNNFNIFTQEHQNDPEEAFDELSNDSRTGLNNDRHHVERNIDHRKCSIVPRTTNDYIILIDIIINIITITGGFIFSMIYMHLKWMVASFFILAILIEIGGFTILRYYHIGFKRCDKYFLIIIFSLAVLFLFCINIALGGFVYSFFKNLVQIILVFIDIGWALVVIFLVVHLKIMESIIINSRLRIVTFATLILILIAWGIVIIVLSTFDSTGSGIIILCVYFAYKIITNFEWTKSKLGAKWLVIIEKSIIIFISFVLMIATLTLIETDPIGAFSILSYPMLLLTFTSFIGFYSEYKKNEKERKVRIFVYNQKIFPMLKFETATGILD